MDDLISRQAALETVGVNTWAGARISKLPSVKPKKGFWEYVDDVDYRCSVCHKYAYGCLGEVLSGHYKYCPYCGAAMEGEEDDAEEIL